jgi:hypothetical protein
VCVCGWCGGKHSGENRTVLLVASVDELLLELVLDLLEGLDRLLLGLVDLAQIDGLCCGLGELC